MLADLHHTACRLVSLVGRGPDGLARPIVRVFKLNIVLNIVMRSTIILEHSDSPFLESLRCEDEDEYEYALFNLNVFLRIVKKYSTRKP